MKTVTKYILEQVAANQLSHGEAKMMLLKLQELAAGSTPPNNNTTAIISEGTDAVNVPLIPVQRCFFERNFPEPHYWNFSLMLHSRKGFDAKILGRVLEKIMAHHDALRMVYRISGPEVIQTLPSFAETSVDFTVLDLTYQTDAVRQIETETARIQGSFDLEKGPLIKAGLFKTDQGDHLLLVAHHLVFDGESWRILVEDLQTGYIQAMSGAEILLPKKTGSFLEWAWLLQEYGRSERILGELDYWRRIDQTRVAPLPKDHPVHDRRFQWSKIITVQLPEEDSARLLKERPYELSVREVLLIAFGSALKEWTGEDKALIRVIGQGRDLGLGGLNLTRTIGWLSISYPVILAPGGAEAPGDAEAPGGGEAPGPDSDPGAQIRKMRDHLREVPGNGAGYDILRYITLPLKKELPPLTSSPEIIFNFLGLIDGPGMVLNDSPVGRIEVSQIPMGWMKSPESPKEYTLDVTIYISAGKLAVNLDYNRLEYEEETIRHFGELFLGKVKRLLAMENTASNAGI